MTDTNNSSQISEAEENIPFSEADILFLEDLGDIRTMITNDAMVTSHVGAINKIEDRISSIKDTKADHVRFYNEKIEKMTQQADYLKQRIMNYLETKNESSLPTPLGTAFVVERKKYDYPSDDVLLEYARRMNVPIEEKVEFKVNKNDIKKKIEETNELPDGIRIRVVPSLSIRRS